MLRLHHSRKIIQLINNRYKNRFINNYHSLNILLNNSNIDNKQYKSTLINYNNINNKKNYIFDQFYFNNYNNNNDLNNIYKQLYSTNNDKKEENLEEKENKEEENNENNENKDENEEKKTNENENENENEEKEENEKSKTKEKFDEFKEKASNLTPEDILSMTKKSVKATGSFLKESIFEFFKPDTDREEKKMKGLIRKGITKSNVNYEEEMMKNQEDKNNENDELNEDDENIERSTRTDITVVHESKGAYDRMKERLNDMPFIKNIWGFGEQVKNSDAGKGMRDKVEDVREFWETSQNPLVFKLSSAWDTVTGETDRGRAIRELRKIDPDFILEDWLEGVQHFALPDIISALLEEDIDRLEAWMEEGPMLRLTSEIQMRQAEGTKLDPHVLDIRQCDIAGIQFDDALPSPAIVVQFMAQQINCVKNIKGEIVEGAEDEIRANFYAAAFIRHYDEELGDVEWKVMDFGLIATNPWF